MLKSTYPEISDDSLKDILYRAKDFAASSGILKLNSEGCITTLQHTLLPSPFPASQFEQATDLQKSFNLLYHRVSLNHTFLASVIEPAISQDKFLNSLWKIYLADHNLKPVQKIKLSLNRSDYMLHASAKNEKNDCINSVYTLKQVELNLIAASFGGLMERVVLQHQFNLSLVNRNLNVKLPVCPSSVGFAKAIVRSQEEYIQSIHSLGLNVFELEPTVLVVISEVERNIFDQRAIEYSALSLKPSLNWIRRTFQQLSSNANRIRIDSDKRLFVDGLEIALIYYRTGYTPQQFTEQAWETKLLLERTMAIKCPSIDYLLANTKLVQTALAQPGVLAQFVSNEDTFKKLSQSFAKQTFLSNNFEQASIENMKEMIADCYRYPDNYVLKPQREGGGNNIFGVDIVEKLNNILETPEANAFILMEKIQPPTVENCVVAMEYSPPLRRQMISELGIFGVLLSNENEILENCTAGHVLRSKFVGMNESGIAAEFGCLDSPYLI